MKIEVIIKVSRGSEFLYSTKVERTLVINTSQYPVRNSIYYDYRYVPIRQVDGMWVAEVQQARKP